MIKDIKLNYEVNPETLAVIAKEINGQYISEIMENGELADYYVNQSPRKVMDYACKYFGSSLKGRQDGTKNVCGITHKAPISIDYSSGMYFFPTTSPQNPNCSWISHSHIDQIMKGPEQSTKIIFKNGRSVTLSVSHGSIINQVHRTAQFRYLLQNRIQYVLKA
ncbi:competence protein ComK [Aquibacillus koreensis]|uniref:Competence protein ComK n=1 Tax=Aquibacillus koreensis TaxID=279446 RepID=A0A9X3WJM6_9BACI|nr:competence protein ComK [Aquibacillus koreensis]MCT2535597.1 competence protein ComK [Aquibacillus koreensis]MDC3420118.1 competence protein ComK [Aquibacillus koreensis]